MAELTPAMVICHDKDKIWLIRSSSKGDCYENYERAKLQIKGFIHWSTYKILIYR